MSASEVLLVDELQEHERDAIPKFVITGTTLQGGAQNPVLVDADLGDRSLKIQCELAHVCHGTLSKGGTPATLVVLSFVFQPRGNNKRFKSVEITMKFSSGSKSRSPEICAISPSQEWAIFPSTKTEEVSHTISPTIEGNVGLAKGALGYQYQYKETETTEARARVTGLIETSSGGRYVKDTASWGLYENPETKSGIPSLFRAAVLIKRPYDTKFHSTLEFVGQVSRLVEMEEKTKVMAKVMRGRVRKGEDVIFNPTSSIASLVTDLDNLGQENLERFKKLVLVEAWSNGHSSSDHQDAPERGLVNSTQGQQGAPKLGSLTDGEGQASTIPPKQEPVIPNSQKAAVEVALSSPALDATGISNVRGIMGATVNTAQSSASVPNPSIPSASRPMTMHGERPSIAVPQVLPSTESFVDHGYAVDAASGKSGSQSSAAQKLEGLRKEVAQATDDRLAELHGELARVRIEANLVRALIRLESDERRIVQEIVKLEAQSSI